jgi:hypothetical protein
MRPVLLTIGNAMTRKPSPVRSTTQEPELPPSVAASCAQIHFFASLGGWPAPVFTLPGASRMLLKTDEITYVVSCPTGGTPPNSQVFGCPEKPTT